MQKKADIINQIKDLILLLDFEAQRKLVLELTSKIEFQKSRRKNSESPKMPWEKYGPWDLGKWSREELYDRHCD